MELNLECIPVKAHSAIFFASLIYAGDVFITCTKSPSATTSIIILLL